jgi:hypothetical protein
VQNINLVFTTADHVLAKAIRRITGSEASHVALGVGHYAFLHATATRGVVVDPREVWLTYNRIVAEYRVVPYVEDRIVDIIATVGTEYDFGSLIGQAVVALGRRAGVDVLNPFASGKDKALCPRLVMMLDQEGDRIPAWKGLDPDSTSPADLLQICQENPKVFEKLPTS